jgi:DNA polymerase-1
MKWMYHHWGISLSPVWDTAVAERLLNPECLERGLKALVLRYAPEMGRYDAPVAALVQERGGKKDGWARITDEELVEYGAMDADGSLRVAEAQYAKMDADDLKLMSFYSDLIQHLTRVEIHGIRVDIEHLAALEVEMGGPEGAVALAEARLWGKLGCDPNSPLQVKKYFGTPDAQKTTLEALNHPLATELLEYKRQGKLYSTYVKGVAEKQHDGVLHTDFRVDGTSTGRLSGRNPNLQNIAKVARIKAMYLPDVGCVLYEIDYSQAEIRLVADMANDEVMLADLAEGVDFHLRAAQTMYEKQKIDEDERFAGKATTFLILYGGNAVGLSQRIGKSVPRCRKLINNYYQRYQALHRWQFAQVRSAKQNGYVSTRFGRKYRFPAIDWDTPSQQMRKYRRIAVNAPVQGSIGQITQMAEMAIESELQGDGYQVLLQVHDSVLVSVPIEEHESGRAATRLRGVCENLDLTQWGGSLRVPLKVDIKWGPNWGSMTKLDAKGELSVSSGI